MFWLQHQAGIRAADPGLVCTRGDVSTQAPDMADGGASAPLTVSWDTSAVATITIME